MKQTNRTNGAWGLAAVFVLLASGIKAQTAPGLDARIESTTRNSHVFKTYLKDDRVSVDSEKGVVTLSGTVSSRSHKSLAEATAENVRGVKSVTNNIAVLPDEGNSDGWIGTKVRTTLLFYRNVRGLRTEVDVKDGAVTLRGEANSAAQKDLTTEYVKDVDGVTSVNNQMTVAAASAPKESMGKKIDDASITAQVKLALLYHRSTSALSTSVKTNRGVVEITGKAMNGAEKDLVTKLVRNIDGVTSVQNRMTVGPTQ